jgi:hypothetical protein
MENGQQELLRHCVGGAGHVQLVVQIEVGDYTRHRRDTVLAGGDPFAEIAGVLPNKNDVGACETGVVEIMPFVSEYWLRKSLRPER